MKYSFYLVMALAMIFTSCKKELSQEGQTFPKPEVPVEPEPPVEVEPKFRITDFYSDIPVDWDESDGEEILETELWKYVYDYIKDDYITFTSDSTLEIAQNAIKLPGLDDDILYRSYSFGTDNAGEFIMYLSADYQPLKYRVEEWSADYFIISVKSKDNSRVFSRFERVP